MLYPILNINTIYFSYNVSSLKQGGFVKGLNNHDLSFSKNKFHLVNEIFAKFFL